MAHVLHARTQLHKEQPTVTSESMDPTTSRQTTEDQRHSCTINAERADLLKGNLEKLRQFMSPRAAERLVEQSLGTSFPPLDIDVIVARFQEVKQSLGAGVDDQDVAIVAATSMNRRISKDGVYSLMPADEQIALYKEIVAGLEQTHPTGTGLSSLAFFKERRIKRESRDAAANLFLRAQESNYSQPTEKLTPDKIIEYYRELKNTVDDSWTASVLTRHSNASGSRHAFDDIEAVKEAYTVASARLDNDSAVSAVRLHYQTGEGLDQCINAEKRLLRRTAAGLSGDSAHLDPLRRKIAMLVNQGQDLHSAWDQVLSAYEDLLTENVPPELAAITVEHCLEQSALNPELARKFNFSANDRSEENQPPQEIELLRRAAQIASTSKQ